ncbi:MAG: hypothetical protein DYG88_02640 [Chloroflexi bacterium CFX4]|nr:hypothetical protein [Chloroflexi bacterium CFX4]MDL1922549.1 hypothetical protein [Chloroflexi bacterium CFX3]
MPVETTPAGLSVDAIVSALLWAIFATVIAQVVSLIALWILGVPPRRIRHEIEEVQNPAVGALYFVIALIASLWAAKLASDGLPQIAPPLETFIWIAGGIVVASAFTALAFVVAHRLLIPEESESAYGWIKRECIAEQNISLALFLGGLACAPFLTVLFQIF